MKTKECFHWGQACFFRTGDFSLNLCWSGRVRQLSRKQIQNAVSPALPQPPLPALAQKSAKPNTGQKSKTRSEHRKLEIWLHGLTRCSRFLLELTSAPNIKCALGFQATWPLCWTPARCSEAHQACYPGTRTLHTLISFTLFSGRLMQKGSLARGHTDKWQT